MPNPTVPGAAEGMPIHRRAIITGGTSMLAVAATARILGATDLPEDGPLFKGAEKFDGSGWYAFEAHGRVESKYVLFAQRDDGHPFIALSAGRHEPVVAYLSHRQFDRACWGRVRTVADIERGTRLASWP